MQWRLTLPCCLLTSGFALPASMFLQDNPPWKRHLAETRPRHPFDGQTRNLTCKLYSPGGEAPNLATHCRGLIHLTLKHQD